MTDKKPQEKKQVPVAPQQPQTILASLMRQPKPQKDDEDKQFVRGYN